MNTGTALQSRAKRPRRTLAGPAAKERRTMANGLRKMLWAVVLLLAALGIAASGCGDSAVATSTATTVAPATGPSAQPPAGWKKFTGGGAEIYLPPAFEGGDRGADVQNVVKRLRVLGPGYQNLAAALEADPAVFAIWAFDPAGATSGFLTNLSVVLDRTPTGVTLKEYIRTTAEQLPADFHIAGSAELRLNGREAARLVMDFTVQGVQGSQLIYIVKNPSGIWTLTYSTSAAEFQARLPDLEKSAATFRTG
jgi:hypothetical protein